MDILISAAIEAQQNAYAPYSKYPVGAALLTSDGKIFSGCCVENAAYPLGACAEKNAVAAAVASGHREFTHIAIVSKNGGAPCGSCRQVLHEFSPNLQIVLALVDGTICHETTLDRLLPKAFGPESLEIS